MVLGLLPREAVGSLNSNGDMIPLPASADPRSYWTPMMPWFAEPAKKAVLLRPAHIAFASFSALIAVGNIVGSASARDERSVASVESRIAGDPIMAIVSLRSQQITVYDPKGCILRASVSSGQKGRETPAGIFSVIEKEAEHYSNLYDDAYSY